MNLTLIFGTVSIFVDLIFLRKTYIEFRLLILCDFLSVLFSEPTQVLLIRKGNLTFYSYVCCNPQVSYPNTV